MHAEEPVGSVLLSMDARLSNLVFFFFFLTSPLAELE
jgi:hypothetical protein